MSRAVPAVLVMALLIATDADAQESTPAPPPSDGKEVASEVVVKGTRVRPRAPSKDRGVAGSVVQGPRLRAPGKQAADVLRSEPGVAVAQTGGQGALATASIRGATSAQTPIYLAGVRVNDDVAGSADLSMIPLWLIQRVEVYRGNAPLEADRLGIGGAVFFEPVRPRKLSLAAGALVGSYGTRGLWAWGADGNDRRAALVGIRFDRADNDYRYVDDRGTRFDAADDVERQRSNADVGTIDAWAIGGASVGEGGRVDVVLNATRREQGVPGLALIPTQAARSRATRTLAAVSGSAPCAENDRCLVRLSSSALLAGSVIDDPLRELALAATRVELSGRRADQSASLRIDLHDRLTIVPSLRASAERLLVDADEQSVSRASRAASRAAVGAEWRASGKVAVRALGSGECHGTSQSGMTFCSHASPSGRVGAELAAGRLTFLGHLGYYERVPTLAELYGLAGAVRGNPELSPERGTTLDAGVRSSWTRDGVLSGAFLDLFAFVRTASDLVAWRRSSVGYVRPYNVASARVAGLELLAGAGLGGFFDAELAATLLDPRDTSSSRAAANDFLPFRSRLVVSPSARLHTSSWSSAGIDTAAIEVRYTHQSSRYADSAGLVVIPEQGSLDLEGSLAILDEHLALRLRWADVLDQARFDTVGYPLPRRSWFAASELQW